MNFSVVVQIGAILHTEDMMVVLLCTHKIDLILCCSGLFSKLIFADDHVVLYLLRYLLG